MKRNAEEKNLPGAEEVRAFMGRILKAAYSDPNIGTGEAAALGGLAMALDRFLRDSERREDAPEEFLRDLQEITEKHGGGLLSFAEAEEQIIGEGQRLITESGRYFYLGELIGSGGEGSVYRIPGMPGKAAKIYRPGRNIDEKQRHIRALKRKGVPGMLNGMVIAAVPEELLYTEDWNFAGILMPRITTHLRLLDVLRDTKERMQNFPDLDYRGMIAIAYNLAEIMNCMHENGVVIGDINLQNILVNTDGTLSLIDADSFDVTDPVTGEHFPCRVGTPEFMAPEVLAGGRGSGSLSSGPTVPWPGEFTEASDRFSLALLIFRLLMNNADPFGCAVSADASVSWDLWDSGGRTVMNGECPYVREIPGRSVPDWAPPFNTLPDRLQELFRRTFSYTPEQLAEAVRNRPSCSEWMEALMEYYKSPLKRCRKDLFHWYREELPECPFCRERTLRMPPPLGISLALSFTSEHRNFPVYRPSWPD